MMQPIRNFLRLLRIAYILARHDALFVLDAFKVPFILLFPLKIISSNKPSVREGKRLAAALEALGPTFIKLGQTLSTRADLIGDDMALDLAGLRDDLPAFSTTIAKATVAAQLGAPVESLFRNFEDVPVAAASIAQVHFAVMHTGEEVAVKILRPGIEAAFARDLELFVWLAGCAEQWLPAWRRLKPMEVVSTFREWIALELDLRMEASAATQLKHNMRNDTGFHVPQVYWQFTSQRVLTLERINGIPLSDLAAIDAAGIDRNGILEKAAAGFFHQMFRDGFFHADPHPGNLFVMADGTIAVVDFGIMGSLDWQTRLFIAEMLHAFLREDYYAVADVHFRAGYVPAHKSMEQFALACMAIAKPILGRPLNEISIGRLLGQLFRVTETFEMETQPQLLLLQKTLVVTEGVGRMLNPNVNMWKLAEPLVKRWAAENMGAAGQIRTAAKEAATHIRKLPMLIKNAEQILIDYEANGLRLHPHTIERLRKNNSSSKWGMMALAVALLVASLAALSLR